ncbi:hypothetical protein [Hymenobacter glaciei]|uniref:hypothetical protein n=1 Tax=Hymenobacter glaciei TaxID=877209 RepID=UPI0031EAB5DB
MPTASSLRLLLPRLGIALALAPFLLLCAFNQPFFDDFRNGTWMREHGTWGVQLWLFQTWTGRFTTTFIMTVLNPVAYGWLGGVKVASAVLFLGLWASLAHLLRALRWPPLGFNCTRRQAWWAAGLLLVLFCNAAPAPFSFLYWFAGALVYQLTLIGLLNFTALALRVGWGPAAGRRRAAIWACLPLVLALTGNELTLVQALPVLAVLALALPRAVRPALLGWLLIAVLAAVVAITAPGNWARAAAMAPPSDPYYAYRWLVLIPRSVLSMGLFLVKPMHGLSALAAGGLGWWAGRQVPATAPAPRPLARRQWWTLLLAYAALNFIGFLLFRYLVVGAPLMRAQNEILLVLLGSTAGLGWLVGRHSGIAASSAVPEALSTVSSPENQQPFESLSPLMTQSQPEKLPQLVELPPMAAASFPQRLVRLASLLLLVGLLAAGHVPEAWRELATSAVPFDAQMQARFAALRMAHRAGTPHLTLPPLRLPYGRVLIPLRQFNSDIEFDIDLTKGCEGNINGVMENYFEVPDVCCEPDAMLDEGVRAKK